MIPLGDYQLGDWISLDVVTSNASGVPTAPTTCPTLTIIDASGTSVLSRLIPPVLLGSKTGLFGFQQPLDSNFSAQQYFALIEWTVGSFDGKQISSFEVVAGGNNKGAYDSIHFYDRPHADFIVGKTDIGTLETRRNPRA